VSKADFNLQLTRVIALLYDAHPRTLIIESDSLCVPPLDRSAPDYLTRRAISGGTLTWLFRNGIVGGEFVETGDGSAVITDAQLTAHGYGLATKSDPNAGGKELGQVALEAIAKPESHDGKVLIELVARRVSGG
jgi:hypothetical protein